MLNSGEMYMLAIKNPKAKFKRLVSGRIYSFSDAGILRADDTDSNFTPRLNEEWELIPQEIPWQEAMQHWLDGKEILCELNENKCWYRQPNGFGTVSRNELANGKWYLV